MEVAAALGLAGNVVQFIDFSQKLCSTFFELHRSASEYPKATEHAKTLAEDFLHGIDTLADNLREYKQALGSASSNESDSEKAITKVSRELANELLEQIEKLKPEGHPRRLKVLFKAVRYVFTEKKLLDLQRRLNDYRSQMEFSVILSLRGSIELIDSRQRDQFSKLQETMKTTIAEIIRENILSLPHWPASIQPVDPPSQQNEEEESVPTPSLDDDRDLESVEEPPTTEPHRDLSDRIGEGYAHSLAQAEEAALNSLQFVVMKDREEMVSPAELATFEWIFKPPRSDQRPWSNFKDWLQSDESMYWISGKAGSGKSTLMKHLLWHPTTRIALHEWAGTAELLTPSFFFWYSGTDLQRSQIGLLRSILHQCLQKHRELIPFLLPNATGIKFGSAADFAADWSLVRLKDTFNKLIHQDLVPMKICFFIDGLDEYAGDHFEIAEMFKSVAESKNIKLCVSSRPLLVFDQAFRSFPGLVLQHLTFDDIETYIKSRLHENEMIDDLESQEAGFRDSIASEIVTKASGVFLWVKLVVQSLLEGLRNSDRPEDMRRRLDELPEDLEDLYWHMIDRVTPKWYLEEGFRLLLLVKTARVAPSLLRLAFATMSDPNYYLTCPLNGMTVHEQAQISTRTAARIKTRCLGLLEISESRKGLPHESFVSFLHKSVYDFLDTPKAKAKMEETLSKEEFLAEVQFAKALLLELKTEASRIPDIETRDGVLIHLKREDWFDCFRPVALEARKYYRQARLVASNVDASILEEIDKIAGGLWELVTFKFPEDDDWVSSVRKPVGGGHTTVQSTPELIYDEVKAMQNRSIERESKPSSWLSRGGWNPITRLTHALANILVIPRNDNA